MKSNLLPQNVNLIQPTPQGPFLTEIYSALMLSIILVMPIVVREFAGFIGPGLYKREKTVVYTQLVVQIWAGYWYQHIP
jgi:sec-independent protein translocase protein TatC